MSDGNNPIPLLRLADIVENLIGLYFPRARFGDLERGLLAAAKELGMKSPMDIAVGLLDSTLSAAQIEVLTANLTIGETYFNREKPHLDALETIIIPEIYRKKKDSERTLRIWSAGCSTGEEPYSIATVINRFGGMLDDWKITILATDINTRSLKAAQAAEYGEWSFRGNPQSFRDQYFEISNGKRLKLKQNIVQMVNFQYLNLVEDSFPSLLNNTAAIDVIFCRNVLIYFSDETRKKLIGKFFNSLVDGGLLFVSSTETSALFSSDFKTQSIQGSTVYSKGGQPREACFPAFAHPVEPAPGFQSWNTPIARSQETRQSVFNPAAPAYKIPSKPQFVPPKPQARPAVPALGLAEAETLCASGKYEAASSILKEILKREPRNSRAMTLLSKATASVGNLKEALIWCEGAVAADVLNPSSHFLKYTILQEMGRLDEARDTLRTVIYLDDNFILGHMALGNIARRQGRDKDAERHMEHAMELLKRLGENEIVPESEGMTAGRFMQIIGSTLGREVAQT